MHRTHCHSGLSREKKKEMLALLGGTFFFLCLYLKVNSKGMAGNNRREMGDLARLVMLYDHLFIVGALNP